MKKNIKNYLAIAMSVVTITGISFSSFTKIDVKNVEASSYYASATNATITLSGTSAKGSGEGYSVKNGVVTISEGGTYVLKGDGKDVQILVDAPDENVTLVLDGLTLTNNTDAPIYFKNVKNATIVLEEGSKNTLSDVASKVEVTDENKRDASAVIYSTGDLDIEGTGTLVVNGNYNNGIATKDDLKIKNGTFIVNAINNGFVGKDSITIKEGNFTLNVENDGFQSDNTTEGKGYILIDGGMYEIKSANDGIQAESLLTINNGTFNIVTNGGAENAEVRINQEFGGNRPDGFGMGRTPDVKMFRAMLTNLDEAILKTIGITSLDSISDSELETIIASLTEEQLREVMEIARPNGEGMIRPADAGTIKPADEGRIKPADAGTIKPEDEGTIRPADAGAIKPTDEGTIRPEDEGTIKPTDAGTIKPADEGTISPENDTNLQTEETISESYKALKANEIIINGGDFTINSADDSIHSNGNLTINNGKLELSAGDDAIHGEGEVIINDGEINVLESYEGIEGFRVTVNGGEVDITSSDDGINATSESTSGVIGASTFNEETDPYIMVNNGIIYVKANGDGIDSNAAFFLNGGEVYVLTSPNGPDIAIDFDNGPAEITGGTLLGVGSSSMLHNFSETSEQNSITYYYDTQQKGGDILQILDSTGKVVIEIETANGYDSVIATSPDFISGESYTIKNSEGENVISLSTTSKATSNGTTKSTGERKVKTV